MTLSPEYPTIDPKLIQVPIRQRTEVGDVSDLETSIARYGQHQPIVIDRALNLIIGGRRLQACLNLGIPITFRFRDTLSPFEAKIVEYDENAKRKDLPWRDAVRAVHDLHQLGRETHGANVWPNAATANPLGLSNVHASLMLRVYHFLSDPRLAAASSFSQARMVVERIQERNAATAVGDIIANSGNLFGSEGNANATNSANGIKGTNSVAAYTTETKPFEEESSTISSEGIRIQDITNETILPV